MTISELQNELPPNNSKNTKDTVRILFSCPMCKTRKELEIDKTIINQKKQLTTISFSAGLICEHCFQAFIDKNFKVRGYQKVDYEFSNDVLANKLSLEKDYTKEEFLKDKELLENLNIKANHLEYNPKKKKNRKTNQKKHSEDLRNNYSNAIKEIQNILLDNKQEKQGNKSNLRNKKGDEMDVKEIFEEFREFIDKDNPEFSEFLKNDKVN
ncbi:MAG: hypothetical protein GF353_29950 [Candidatus Lokiarchaeota archaeon]|nr:hypothetical protein [Candidatus Lokiarchaeota archaeon]